jgi:hypothetical protein
MFFVSFGTMTPDFSGARASHPPRFFKGETSIFEFRGHVKPATQSSNNRKGGTSLNRELMPPLMENS